MEVQKVLHPFDLDLTFLAILRKAFEKAEQESNIKGMSLDVTFIYVSLMTFKEPHSSYCPDSQC